ncbi:MAG: PEGA domain-containing protein [Bryobacterales bacterium]|nr:PEGA domain-containing protein [Bryobacterales bacterium]
MKRLLLAGALVLAMLPVTAAAHGEFGRVGGFGRFGAYGRFGGFGFGGRAFLPMGWGGWYGPYWNMYPYWPWYGTPNAGQVKLETHLKDAQVYINGNYAGTAGQLKTMTLTPGNYSIEVRAPGRSPYRQNVHVLAGKTLKLHPDLPLQTPAAPKEAQDDGTPG